MSLRRIPALNLCNCSSRYVPKIFAGMSRRGTGVPLDTPHRECFAAHLAASGCRLITSQSLDLGRDELTGQRPQARVAHQKHRAKRLLPRTWQSVATRAAATLVSDDNELRAHDGRTATSCSIFATVRGEIGLPLPPANPDCAGYERRIARGGGAGVLCWWQHRGRAGVSVRPRVFDTVLETARLVAGIRQVEFDAADRDRNGEIDD
jgi:hypothetical protein